MQGRARGDGYGRRQAACVSKDWARLIMRLTRQAILIVVAVALVPIWLPGLLGIGARLALLKAIGRAK